LPCGGRLRLIPVLVVVYRQQLQHPVPDLAPIGPTADKDLVRDALAPADQAKQDVLGSYVVMTHPQRLAQCEFERLFRVRRKRNVPDRCDRVPVGKLRDLLACRVQADAKGL
jgi:hypothetical protein